MSFELKKGDKQLEKQTFQLKTHNYYFGLSCSSRSLGVK